ncbi:ribulose-phosphate 3-epimerase [Cuniculiplasma sp. SKW3]|uniref:ribulose-phosphate 3-epimerase n=1 Tax=unclassified Cuniculiplasma TaxID=2619706 RepID=UPI003FD6A0ED
MNVSPSIISSKLEFLHDEVSRSVKAGASSFHLDIMDGNFVPNLTMGPDLISAVRRSTDLELDAHMMILNPEKYWKVFSKAGCDLFYFHYETPFNFKKVREEIRNEKKGMGLVINPDTPPEMILDFLPEIDKILVMSVYPGFSGQKFIPKSLEKISYLRKYIDENGLSCKIEVDGGIDVNTGAEVKKSGADIIVSASYIYGGIIEERIGNLLML